MLWSHQNFHPVSTMKLLGIMFINRYWPATFHTFTIGNADGWYQNWLVWSVPQFSCNLYSSLSVVCLIYVVLVPLWIYYYIFCWSIVIGLFAFPWLFYCFFHTYGFSLVHIIIILERTRDYLIKQFLWTPWKIQEMHTEGKGREVERVAREERKERKMRGRVKEIYHVLIILHLCNHLSNDVAPL